MVDPKIEPLTSPRAMLKGWLAGSLFAASFLEWYIFPLIVLAILVFLDSVIAIKDFVHIITTITFAIIGIIIAFLFAIFSLLYIYVASVIVIAFLFYFSQWKKPKIFKKLKK